MSNARRITARRKAPECSAASWHPTRLVTTDEGVRFVCDAPGCSGPIRVRRKASDR